MDSGSTRCVAMMAIKPQFAFGLLTGRKRVEFRRRAAARKLTHIVVYATKPVGAVVGVLEISDLAEGTPQSLWSRFSNVGGIGRSDFFDYFAGTEHGIAYLVQHVWSCDEARELGKVGLPRVPPQAHQYLSSRTLEQLRPKGRQGPLDATIDYESWLAMHCRSQVQGARG